MNARSSTIEQFLNEEQNKIDRADNLLETLDSLPWYRLWKKERVYQEYKSVVESFRLV